MTRRIAETYAARGVVVVGVGADGWSGLSEAARHALRAAGTIIGSPRQLEQLPVWLGPRRQEWRSPRREDIRALIEEHADGGVAVLASGDPLVYGIGRTLVEELGIDRLLFLPNLSSVSLACARLGWPAEDVAVLNAPGGGLDALPSLLADGARLIVLSAGRDTPATVATRLADQGYGPSELVVLGDLGSAREDRWDGTAAGWDAEVTSGLNLVAVTCRRDPGAPTVVVAATPATQESTPTNVPADAPAPEAPAPGAPAPGAAAREAVPGPAIEPDRRSIRGQRASTYGVGRLADLGPLLPGLAGQPRSGTVAGAGLMAALALVAALDPAPGEILWEAGGPGRAAIAWSLAAPGARALVVGEDPAGAGPPGASAPAGAPGDRDRATPFGIVPVVTVAGTFPAAAPGLPTPDAVLLSGAALATPRAVETAWRALRLGGRLVGAATTLEEAARLARYHRAMGGDLTRLQLADGTPGEAGTRYDAGVELVLWSRRKTPTLD